MPPRNCTRPRLRLRLHLHLASPRPPRAFSSHRIDLWTTGSQRRLSHCLIFTSRQLSSPFSAASPCTASQACGVYEFARRDQDLGSRTGTSTRQRQHPRVHDPQSSTPGRRDTSLPPPSRRTACSCVRPNSDSMHPFSTVTLGIFVAGYITARWDLVTRLYELAIFAWEYGVVVRVRSRPAELAASLSDQVLPLL